MGNLILKVEVDPRCDDINVLFQEASELAQKLALNCVEFHFDCMDCFAYPDFHGVVIEDGNTVGKWSVMIGYWPCKTK